MEEVSSSLMVQKNLLKVQQSTLTAEGIQCVPAPVICVGAIHDSEHCFVPPGWVWIQGPV